MASCSRLDSISRCKQFVCTLEDGNAVDITVPEGCGGGEIICVSVPQSHAPPPADLVPVDVIVPDGVYGGSTFSVEYAGGVFDIVCPDGCGPGSAIVVDLPSAPMPPEQPAPAPLPRSDKENLPEGFEKIGKTGKGLALSLNIGGGIKLSLALATQGKYRVGQQVEVLRSDGTWSLASVKEYDCKAVNYTVMLPDTRLKHMVEEEDLRQPVLGYSAAARGF